MNKNKSMLKELSISYLDAFIIMSLILFKYLINYGIQIKLLYIYLMIICILTLLNIYDKKFTIQEFNKIIIFFIISLYFIIVHRDVNFFISFLLAIVCIRRKNKEFVKVFFISSIILYLSTIILSKVGILHSKEMIRIVNGVTNKRSSLGFTHPNEVFLYFMPIALSGYYLYSNKKFFYIILLCTSTALYKVSYSRTGYIVIFIIIFLNLIKKILNKYKFEKILPYIMVILTITSIIIAILYGENFDNNISNMLSGRPYYWKYYIDNGHMFSIVGKNISPDYFLDNFFLFLLVELGIIGYLIYLVIYYKSLRNLKRDTNLLLVILVFYIYGLSETNVIIGSIQFAFAIQIKSIIIKNKKILKEEIDYETSTCINNSSNI